MNRQAICFLGWHTSFLRPQLFLQIMQIPGVLGEVAAQPAEHLGKVFSPFITHKFPANGYIHRQRIQQKGVFQDILTGLVKTLQPTSFLISI